MSQHSGAFTIELDVTRIVEEIAQRTAVILVGMLRAGPAGVDTYEREQDPDPGAGPTRGRVRDNLEGETP